MKYVELSHRITDGMVTFPGNPPVRIDTFMDREQTSGACGEKAQSMLDQIHMVNISGTYLDSPRHRSDEGYTVADIPLEKCTNLRYQVVTMQKDKNCIDVDDLKGIGRRGGAVLLYTGFDRKFNTPDYGVNPPYLTVEAARLLVERGVVFVGIDSRLSMT